MTLLTQAHHLDHEADLYAATGMRRQARDCADQAKLLRQLAREAEEFHAATRTWRMTTTGARRD